MTSEPAKSFPVILEELWRAKHTGPVVIHFAGGKPQAVEVLEPSKRIPLDNRAA